MLEVWGAAGNGWKLIRSHAILAASGRLGPKLREGDLQVPEGVYRLTGFNPNSSYHLSIRVDYPNADDRAGARAEGRTRLGGDIYIHGKAVSIGCVALGDVAIEELYLLVAEVGLARTRLVMSPSAAPMAPPGASAWVRRLYERLRFELQQTRGAMTGGGAGRFSPREGPGSAGREWPDARAGRSPTVQPPTRAARRLRTSSNRDSPPRRGGPSGRVSPRWPRSARGQGPSR